MQTIDGAEVRNFDRLVFYFPFVQWSSDSRRLCVLDADRTTVSILNLDGTTAASYATGHTSAVTAMSWSPDGTLLATWTNNGEFRVASVKAVEAKDDDKEAAAGGKLQITVLAGTFNFGSVSSLAWSPDGRDVAAVQ